jgi:hypothetical protein
LQQGVHIASLFVEMVCTRSRKAENDKYTLPYAGVRCFQEWNRFVVLMNVENDDDDYDCHVEEGDFVGLEKAMTYMWYFPPRWQRRNADVAAAIAAVLAAPPNVPWNDLVCYVKSVCNFGREPNDEVYETPPEVALRYASHAFHPASPPTLH